MNSTEITADQSRSARTTLGISQAFAAKSAGINRSQLALFEVGKYQLEAFKLLALRKCYETLGYAFDGQAHSQPPAAQLNAPPPSIDNDIAAAIGSSPIASLPETPAEPAPRTVENLVVVGDFDQDDIDYTLAEIQFNDSMIENLIDTPVKLHWLTEKPLTEQRDAIVRLMARNYQLMRSLQSEEILPAATDAAGDSAAPATAGQLAAVLLDGELGVKEKDSGLLI